jgi:dTDP-4-dehydrorhamnose reductase
MKILLIGFSGQLGWELQRSMLPLGEITALDRPDLNLAEPETLRPLVRQLRPQVIVNAAAYTAVDQAENEPGLAHTINCTAPEVLAQEARSLGAALIHYSTDYVFDGEKKAPYTEADPTNPINVYGQSKLAGEQAVQAVGGAYLVLRTSWVYSLRRGSFVTKVLEWARSQPVLRIVDDQVSSPTWCRSLASATALVLARAGSDPAGWLAERRGLYHLADCGSASRYEWAKTILELDPEKHRQVTEEVLPARSSDFPTPAKRPAQSALDCTKFSETFEIQPPDWRLALALAMDSGI